MPRTFSQSWFVFESIENAEHDRCVDLFRRPDDSYGFDEFRRDAEDGGAWTPVGYYSEGRFASRDEALAATKRSVAWLSSARP